MEISIMLKEKYKNLFHISDGDYEKSAAYYNEYLAIFHNLVQGDVFDADNLRIRLENSNPWKNSGYSDGKYEFISLAGTDCDILAPLLIDNIENSQQEDAKEVIQARFKVLMVILLIHELFYWESILKCHPNMIRMD